MITIAVPLIVCLIGLLIYFVTDKPKVAEVSLWAYKVGLVFTLLEFVGHATSWLGK